MSSQPDIQLSRDGERRRAEILHLAEGALGDRVRRRNARRAIVASVPLLALVALVAVLPRGAAVTKAPVQVAHHGIDFDSLVLPYRLQLLDDEGLARELESLGAGIVQVGDEPPRLVSRDGSPFVQPTYAESDGLPTTNPGTS